MSTTPTATPSGSATLTGTLASSLASSLSTALSTTLSATLSSNGTITSTSSASATSDTAPATSSALNVAGSEKYQGITLVAFLTALATGLVVFAIQILAFLLLRNKIARIFKPKTYLVPERERTESPPSAPWSLINTLVKYNDREIIKKCGLDAYFFLRYLRTLLTIFIPIAAILIPILTPLNYNDGQGHNLVDDAKDETTNDTSSSSARLMARDNTADTSVPTGLDTLAWGNVGKNHTGRYWAHLILALLVIIWVCTVFFFELRVYVKVRQDYLTSAEHRLRASATTILVNSIPSKWLTEEALMGLFDVFPGQIRNIWLNRDLTPLLEKIQQREDVHLKLESAETDLVKAAKNKQLKRKKQEEKAARKASKSKGPSRQEQALRRQAEDAEAKKRAEAGQGVSSGEHDEVPHDISAVINENRDDAKSRRSSTSSSSSSEDGNRPQSKGFGLGLIGDGVTKVGKGLLGGLGKAQKEIKEFTEDVDDTVETTNGFAMLHPDNRPRKVQILTDNERPATPKSTKDTTEQVEPLANTETHKTHSRNVSAVSQETADPNYKRSYEPFGNGNTVRKVSDLDHMYDRETRQFWQFWKAPAGGYASPVPQGYDGGEYPFKQSSKDKTIWQTIKSYIPFMGEDDQIPVDYPEWNAVGGEYKNILDDDAEWRKWVKEKNRPTHRLPRWGFPNWLAWLTFGPKVDTIYWCRSELARLNVEIEDDQAHPERYPLMNSAFIQFNHQVSAHMACQSLMHHIPKHMSPRINEVSPKDVIWDNMAMKWWHESIRSGTVTIIIAAMAFFWAIPIAFTASIANIDGLVDRFPWLDWIKKAPIDKVASAIAGVLPAILLALLLFVVPHILEQLALFRGVKTGSQKAEFVQRFYFVFLFIQVFLVVSIASFFTASAEKLAKNVEGLTNVTNILDLLADNLPRASNYFFSYMLLQALSVSSGTLLQIGAVLVWYILARILDSTARDKWKRNTTLSKIAWGQFFPVYTNFACIALVYCVVAPLISLFAVLTFGLLWFAQRYSMLYVTRFESDTGGVLYPRAINQTFTGLYVMEACLAGLFFIVQDTEGTNTAVPQGIIMLITIGFTAVYQISLNTSFSPLFRYLPITVEDEAVIRDEAFQQAQNKRLGLGGEDGDDADEKTPMRNGDGAGSVNRDIEMQNLNNGAPKRKPSTTRKVKDVGHWAKREGKNLRSKTWKMGPAPVHTAAEYRRQQRNKDLEAQRALGEALYGGFHDEIEDLTPDERDALVKNAFKHYALRARAPAVWLPRDDIGVSDDEIRRTKEYSEHIWISNEGTALDSKVRVVYGANPPDFSEIDIINL
ncbi:hypothetical protein BDP55DRAFT_626552 [Colletotrichum godetiae]|uniref:Duf221 domain-containing protein n=1 Tax=Colletotrichum godetiae TaxID=1209918 RepID=A0AAJ0AZW6_9PEZI|nr:uncharacterized protein BDP55DRAFT_626552 [Colletotrichum godetiae]KAK1699863.1 hypothetical protein BDP55DRAFT_626552 [Colletotrichum godetiae]